MSKEPYRENSFAEQHRAANVAAFDIAPTTSDLGNTLRRRYVPVACWRLNFALFALDSSVVAPAIAAEIPRLAAIVRANVACPASIFGHADPTGDDEYNKVLAGRRARSLFALLVRDPSIWEDLYTKSAPSGGDHWGVRSTQLMLSHLVSPSEERTYYRGVLHGAVDAATVKATKQFQLEHPPLTADGQAGPKTRKILYEAYMDSLLGDFSMSRSDFLGDPVDPNGKGAYQGCGEFNPVVLLSTGELADAERDAKNAPNRRVVVFLYRPDARLDENEWPCPKWNEPTSGCRSQFWPDGNQRRTSSATRREYPTVHRTMACRFYDRFARVSPCEALVVRDEPITVSVVPDVYIDHQCETPEYDNLSFFVRLPDAASKVESVSLSGVELSPHDGFFCYRDELYFSTTGARDQVIDGNATVMTSGGRRCLRFRITKAETLTATMDSLAAQLQNAVGLVDSATMRALGEGSSDADIAVLRGDLLSKAFSRKVHLLNSIEEKLVSHEDHMRFHERQAGLPTLFEHIDKG